MNSFFVKSLLARAKFVAKKSSSVAAICLASMITLLTYFEP